MASLFALFAACGPKQDATQQANTAPTATAPYAYPRSSPGYPQPGRVPAADRTTYPQQPRPAASDADRRADGRARGGGPDGGAGPRRVLVHERRSVRDAPLQHAIRKVRVPVSEQRGLHHAERVRHGTLCPADAAGRAGSLIMVEGSADAPLELPGAVREAPRTLPSSSPPGVAPGLAPESTEAPLRVVLPEALGAVLPESKTLGARADPSVSSWW